MGLSLPGERADRAAEPPVEDDLRAQLRTVHEAWALDRAEVRRLRASEARLEDALAQMSRFLDGEPDRSVTIRLFPSGILWTPFAPDPDLIEIGDIARGLSMKCRFGGAVSCFYSVAEHSVLVSRLIAPRFALAALLHDATEALSGLGDVLGPVKKHPAVALLVGGIERRIDDAVAARFGLPSDFPSMPEVHQADKRALQIEDRDVRGLQPSGGADLWADRLELLSPARAEHAFLARFRELTEIESR